MNEQFPCFDFVVGKTPAGSMKALSDMIPFLKKEWFISTHIVYSKHSQIVEKYKDSHILIVGGGPSANQYEWELYDRDYTWSMNHFFKNDKFKNCEVDLVCIGAEVSQDNIHLIQQEWNPMLGFEPHPHWLSKVNLQKVFPHHCWPGRTRIFGFATHFYSKLGSCVRMAVLAASLGASKVSFIGMGDVQGMIEGNHAFEQDKKLLPSQINPNNIYSVFKYQYQVWYNYMMSNYDTEIEFVDKNNALLQGLVYEPKKIPQVQE